jgi:multiple sugar transport system substrate-binding protein
MTNYPPRKQFSEIFLKFQFIFITLIILCLILGCSSNDKFDKVSFNKSSSNINTTLNIWWEKGFNLEEDEALIKIVKNWEKQTGNQVKLSFYTTTDLLEKAQRGIHTGNTPDVMMSYSADRTFYPIWAWEGKLVDVKDVIEPIESFYSSQALQGVTFANRLTGKSSYYGVPIGQATIHIFYWQMLLKQLGFSSEDIPQDWNSFWEFWQHLQQNLHRKGQKNIYGLGLPFSVNSTDTYFLFEQVLEAYDVTLVDSKGKLLIDNPTVRQGIINCLDWYSQFYQQDYVPPNALNWLNTDNNLNFLNQIVAMTPNTTLSIAGALRQDQDTYYNKMGILDFPNKPNGKAMRYLVSIRQAVIFANSPHQEKAEDFLEYLIQPKVITKYLQDSGGRILPVQETVWKNPFWQQTKDPYITAAIKIIIGGQTRLFYVAQNPAYSLVLKENVWGKALKRIVVDKITPEKAADEAIVRIKQLFQDWENS